MTLSTRLGGFKILKEVSWLSLTPPAKDKKFATEVCRLLAKHKINLPFLACGDGDSVWGVNLVVESHNLQMASDLVRNNFGKIHITSGKANILSIFPHKSNPRVMGSIFDVFCKKEVDPLALANSSSAISVVLRDDIINEATAALFGPFNFSAYRTPADWKLAQKGKEQLYKEVVASYQEQRPKVYGLEYQEGQQLVHVRLTSSYAGQLGTIFEEFARLGLNLTFLTTSPCEDKEILAFCLPASETHPSTDTINGIAPEIDLGSVSPVTTFSMNGPHFGDRYGIASELLKAFKKNKIDLLGLSCTIASITGVVPSPQLESSIQAIRECFEVPSITKKGS